MFKLFYFPSDPGRNEYIKNSVNIWKGLSTDVLPINQSLGWVFGKNKIAILNWLEDVPASSKHPLLSFIKCTSLLLYCVCFFKKIIYVKHNISPHQIYSKHGEILSKILSNLLSFFATVTVTHRPVQGVKSIFIHHPMYIAPEVIESVRSIDYLWVGKILPYKGLHQLLNVWDKNLGLTIAGDCEIPEYASQLESIIHKRELNVVWTRNMVSNEELSYLLSSSKFVLVSHIDKSAIVSGMFYHAASYGCNVVMLPSDFSTFCNSTFSFSHQYGNRYKYIESSQIKEELNDMCGIDKLKVRWENVLKS